MSFIKNVQNVTSTVGKVLKKSYGPLDKLDPSKKEYYTLRYPLDVGNATLYPHTLEFLCWQPRPADQGELVSYNVNDATKAKGGRLETQASSIGNQYITNPSAKAWSGHTQGGGPSNADVAAKFNEIGRARGGIRYNQNMAFNGDRTTDWTKRAELTDMIVMYIPQQALIETFNNTYNAQSMTEAWGNLGLLMDAGASIGKADGIWDKLAALKPFLFETGAKLAGAKGIVGEGQVVGEALLQAAGYATNPQLEVLYGGSNVREFEMQFKMTPRSKKEADEMLKIVHRFKYHASPEYIVNGGRYMVPPSYFDIYINYNGTENDRIPLKFTTCVLQGVSVDMGTGTDQFATYHDGTPIEISMMLRFTELEIMHKKLREDGY